MNQMQPKQRQMSQLVPAGPFAHIQGELPLIAGPELTNLEHRQDETGVIIPVSSAPSKSGNSQALKHFVFAQ